jgi:subtilisin family serine protease
VPDDEEVVIEVEFAPEVENIDDLLAGINIPEPSGGPSSETDFANVVRTHGLVDAQPVFTREDHEKERTRVHTLRESIPGPAEGGGGYEKLRQWEQLPPLSHYVQLRFPPGTFADAVIARLRSLPQVKRAVVVTEAVPPSFPTDEMIGTSGSVVEVDPQTHIQKQWYLHRTRVPQAWQFGRGANVVVADVDFGCHISHRELVGAIEHTHNSFDGTENVTSGEKAGHGTAVLGIVGARSDGNGLAGYAPEAKLWVIQGNTGTSPRKTNTPWSDGIKHVLDTDANGRRKVLLVEVETGHDGNAEQWPSVQRLVQQAIAENHVVCVAAGNGNRDANHDDSGTAFEPTGSILVGATNFHATENIRAGFSNFGPGIVVSAPGDEFHDVTCGPSGDDSYRNKFGGTSGAAAKVAGTVALMLSVNPNLTHDEVRDILRTTGSPITPESDSDTEKPIGVFLNAEAAVLEARNRLDN